MIRDVCNSLGGIGIYGIVSTLLFVAVFAAMLLRVALMRRADIEAAERLPLEGDDELPARGGLQHDG